VSAFWSILLQVSAAGLSLFHQRQWIDSCRSSQRGLDRAFRALGINFSIVPVQLAELLHLYQTLAALRQVIARIAGTDEYPAH